MASVLVIAALLRDPRLWRGQDSPAPAPSRQASGFAAFDAALPAGGWPESALVEVMFSADGIGELSLLLPALAALSTQDKPVLIVAPPYRVYAPAWQAATVVVAEPRLSVVRLRLAARP